MATTTIRNSASFLCSINFNVLSCRHLKSLLPVKWIRPEKIPCIKPEKSGDLKPQIEIDIKQVLPEFKDSEELKTANEYVKRLFTLEYFPYRKTIEVIRSSYLDRVRRHAFDTRSPEARVAKMTADIRDMQKLVERKPRRVATRVTLKEVIDKRKKLLKFLRTWDYKRFEWVLEKLDLVYKPFPPPDVYKRVERKRSLRMLTSTYCDNIVKERLNKYKESLEAQQEKFLQDKIETLKWIMKEEHECGLEASIKETDIKEVEDKLENLRKLRVKPAEEQS